MLAGEWYFLILGSSIVCLKMGATRNGQFLTGRMMMMMMVMMMVMMVMMMMMISDPILGYFNQTHIQTGRAGPIPH
jgi:hypothetical protein